MEFKEIYLAAHDAGISAVNELQVTPMVVQRHANPLNDNSPIVESYFVEDGVCGFASVIVKNIKFANFLKKNNIGRKNWNGGYAINISAFNQSLQKKEAYAYAFSRVLNSNGINSYVDSRMD